MKKLIFLICLNFCSTISFSEIVVNGCKITVKGLQSSRSFEPKGRVFVETDPEEPVDFTVKIVKTSAEATYNVFRTSSPKTCGEWFFVQNRQTADFCIRYVEEQEDVRVFFTAVRSEAGF